PPETTPPPPETTPPPPETTPPETTPPPPETTPPETTPPPTETTPPPTETTPPPTETTPPPTETTLGRTVPLGNGSFPLVPSAASPSANPTTMFPDFSTTLPPDFPVVAALRLKVKTFRVLNSTSASQLLQQLVQQYLPYYSPQNLRMTIRSIKNVSAPYPLS
ncbi:hypothetical protein AOLI_G00115050, partial [Acnodon oligacanthus]